MSEMRFKSIEVEQFRQFVGGGNLVGAGGPAGIAQHDDELLGTILGIVQDEESYWIPG